jgi:hypothetical protein
MSVGWKCKCGHMNVCKDARVGTHIMLGVCEESCGSSNIMIPFEKVQVCEEHDGFFDDNDGKRICKTCEDDPAIAELYEVSE